MSDVPELTAVEREEGAFLAGKLMHAEDSSREVIDLAIFAKRLLDEVRPLKQEINTLRDDERDARESVRRYRDALNEETVEDCKADEFPGFNQELDRVVALRLTIQRLRKENRELAEQNMRIRAENARLRAEEVMDVV